MEHVVFFPAHDGTPAFRRVASLEDAVRLVEHLRNVESINDLSVHALSEVQLSFRTVIKVELPGSPADAQPTRAAEDAAVQDVQGGAAPELVPDPPAGPSDEAGEPPAADEQASELAPQPAFEIPGVVADGPVGVPALEVVPDAEPAVAAQARADGPKSLGFFS